MPPLLSCPAACAQPLPSTRLAVPTHKQLLFIHMWASCYANFHTDLRSRVCTLVLGQCMQGSMKQYSEVTVRHLCIRFTCSRGMCSTMGQSAKRSSHRLRK